jgi:hypothetical protein
MVVNKKMQNNEFVFANNCLVMYLQKGKKHFVFIFMNLVSYNQSRIVYEMELKIEKE